MEGASVFMKIKKLRSLVIELMESSWCSVMDAMSCKRSPEFPESLFCGGFLLLFFWAAVACALFGVEARWSLESPWPPSVSIGVAAKNAAMLMFLVGGRCSPVTAEQLMELMLSHVLW